MNSHLFLRCFMICYVASASSSPILCHDAERSALLHFKQGLSIHPSASIDPSAYPKTLSWKSTGNVSTDCSKWDGVECDELSGHVIGLDLSSSCLYGSIQPNSTLFELVHLQALNLADNNFRGEIPEAFCNATSLKVLILPSNRLSGKIPPCLFNLSSHLEILDLDHNDLHGTIPEAFTSSCKLKRLFLGTNRIEGALPRSLVNCSVLEALVLENNIIVDTFPIWLSGHPGLQAIFLGSNKLHGPLPQKFGIGFPSLYQIELSDNQFTGNMSDELFDDLYAMQKLRLQSSEIEVAIDLLGGEMPIQYSWSHFGSSYPIISVDLSKNRLVGKVPDSIGNLTGLQYLNLSYNNLTGGIPFSFSDLAQLQSLDLSHNRFSGEIPQGLTQLSFLSQIDVSYNQLTGPIPQGVQFNTFNKDSFIGNTGLCGSPLSKKCGNPEVQAASPNESSSKEDEDSTDVMGWVIRSMGYISGLVVGVVIGRMISDENHDWFVKTFGRRQHKKSKKMKQRGIR
ncbi:Receptor-like protein [Drosera capensis]